MKAVEVLKRLESELIPSAKRLKKVELLQRSESELLSSAKRLKKMALLQLLKRWSCPSY